MVMLTPIELRESALLVLATSWFEWVENVSTVPELTLVIDDHPETIISLIFSESYHVNPSIPRKGSSE
jgi:hypothetical protein